MRTRVRQAPIIAAVLSAAFLALVPAAGQRWTPGTARTIAPGVDLYHVTDPSLLEPEAPVSIWLLQLDPRLVRLRSVLANDAIVGTETVEGMALRHSALAAVNAGFFAPNGDPVGVLAVDGQLVSDTRRARGAVAIADGPHGQQLTFDWVRASATLLIHDRRTSIRVPIDGVNTTRLRGRLMLYTSAYHGDTDTAPTGLEWALAGSPPHVLGEGRTAGRTPIPPDGFVLSFGGTTPPPALKRLRPGTRVTLLTAYVPLESPADAWSNAEYVVGGAGLLLREGRPVSDWSLEQFAAGFADSRHPRTMIGTDADGRVWLVTVDGRQPELGAGMTLDELRTLAERLALTNALNLDGGGSTTMWVQGGIVNSPSDAAGPRRVSDGLLVFPRP